MGVMGKACAFGELLGFRKEGKVGWHQVKPGLGFRVLGSDELGRD